MTGLSISTSLFSDLRARIDHIDCQLQELITARACYVQQLLSAKGGDITHSDLYQPEQGSQTLRRVIERNQGPLSNSALVHLFREMMSACLAQQETLKISYLGPEGTFSQQAVLKHFGHFAVGLPAASIEEVYQEVEAGNAEFGVVPVENSNQGVISITLDKFLTSSLHICGEVELRVHQYLLSASGEREKIQRIYAHAQSLAQTAGWLRIHLPGVEKIAVASNAEGARRARDLPDAAAIAADSARHVYQLKQVVKHPIEDQKDNTTRFFVIGRHIYPPSGQDQTSLLISIHNTPGSLASVLTPFARRQINLIRIEPRPSPQAKWAYSFFVDLAGHAQDPLMHDALRELEPAVVDIRILGSYPIAIP